MSHLMNNELVPDTYDYTTLFGLWKGKGNKLDLNMTRYIHGKSWDAKLLEALVTERMKPLITKHCPEMQIVWCNRMCRVLVHCSSDVT